MKNERFFLEKTEFYGYELLVDLRKIGQADFKGLWARLDAVSEGLKLDEDMFFIGYEDYREMTTENKTFKYYAMIPSSYFDDMPEGMVSMVLEEGEYIKFESRFPTHGPKIFQKAYKYLHDNNIDYDNRFDFELIPRDSHPGAGIDEDESLLYIGLKLK
ncbi:hypothetical protein EZV73_12285 [Acidaminobacter sp. JC074]|uniref:GyrI-like domain-containing protein n=1 Tax=Acidaminobacter sp. JC074 TaxID=2530199 RepID=UPI001F0CEFB4|nr:hypothetical protein [Acidaminobacter sp. JC074]